MSSTDDCDTTGVSHPIYLDYCATTPVDPRVLDAMLPFFRINFGNASSVTHPFGRRAREAVEEARNQVAALAGVPANCVIWTSGATESNNLALRGVMSAKVPQASRIITQATEHTSVLDPCDALKRNGYEIVCIGVNSDGIPEMGELEAALQHGCELVSIMASNNETGVILPSTEIASLCRTYGAIYHCDASQSFGKVPMHNSEFDVLSVSAHKLYGPKGVGAFILSPSVSKSIISPQIVGGGQERGLRSGTLNVPAIVGFGEACRVASQELEIDASHMQQLRDDFEQQICSALEGIVVNGKRARRLPAVSNIAFTGVDAESLVIALDDLAVSTGSACTSASLKPSHVLQAMKLPEHIQKSSLRFSFGRFSSIDEVTAAVEMIVNAVNGLRALSAAW